MSEFLFGTTRERLTKRERTLRDRICVQEGGYGFTQIQEPTGDWLGWYAAPNKGEPFDRQLAARVLARVEAATAKPVKAVR
jgi:hypothetical protein